MRKLISITQPTGKDSYLPVQRLQFLKKYCVSNSAVAAWAEHPPTAVVVFFVLSSSKPVVPKAGLTKPSTQNPNVIQLQHSAGLDEEATKDVRVQRGSKNCACSANKPVFCVSVHVYTCIYASTR